MADLAIRVSGLGKKFHITGPRARYLTLRDSLTQIGRSAVGRVARFWGKAEKATAAEEIWALKDVSFDIRQGEVAGIIGHNGAGKSTLLKVLSRITEPTSGEADLIGRVGSLLEVGTGFHPELSGRDNVYLNGALLGMGRREIDRKFDEIVAFSEVEKFIDTPVKHYSSGMYMRLAFAVAAHLEPEILLIDEVLAVGDLAFQRKCLGKINQVSKAGRTVLFVSHNMQAIRSLCSRCILLSRGRVAADGPTTDVVSDYISEMQQETITVKTAVHNRSVRRGDGQVRFAKIQVEDEAGNPRYHFKAGETARFRLGYEVFQRVRDLYVSISLRGGIANEIITGVMFPVARRVLEPGETGEITIEFPDMPLQPGEFPLYFWLGDSRRYPFDVVDGLSAPLMISADASETDRDTDFGYFSIPARYISEN